jgi:hypothetical protein
VTSVDLNSGRFDSRNRAKTRQVTETLVTRQNKQQSFRRCEQRVIVPVIVAGAECAGGRRVMPVAWQGAAGTGVPPNTEYRNSELVSNINTARPPFWLNV